MEAILSNSTWKLLGFQITETLVVVLKSRFYRVIYYNFWHTFVPCSDWRQLFATGYIVQCFARADQSQLCQVHHSSRWISA